MQSERAGTRSVFQAPISRVLTFAATVAVILLPTVSGLVHRLRDRSPVVDDSVWINAGIRDAIRKGDHDYVLPAGDVTIGNPIKIPAGTHDFTIRGAGSTSTTIYTTTRMDSAIVIGDNVQLHNNWGLRNRPNSQVQPVHEGDRTLTLLNGEHARGSHYYVLWDMHTEGANNEFKTVVMNHAEIVHTGSVHGDQVDLDYPVGRDYEMTAQLADIQPFICRNIHVQGIGFNGGNQSPNNTTRGLLGATLIDGIEVSDVKVQHFITNALYFVNCSHIKVSNATMSSAGFNGPGGGYGVALSRCRFAEVSDCSAEAMRHGFIAHAGTTDALFERCKAMTASLDCHGMDERRIQFVDCFTDGTVQVGNQAWPEGDRDVTITNCTCSGGLNVCARAANIVVSRCRLGPVSIQSDIHGYVDQTPDQSPGDVSLTNCDITGTDRLIHEEGDQKHPCLIANVSFRDCNFEASRKEWGNVLLFRRLAGHVTFDHCLFVLGSQRADIPVQISDPYPSFALEISDSEFRSGSATSAVILQPGFGGRCRFVSDILRTGAAGRGSFLKNLSGVPVEESGNGVRGL